MLHADLSVPSTRTVLQTEPVETLNVWIPVLDSVVQMLNAEPLTILALVLVSRDSLVIHLQIVEDPLKVSGFKKCTHYLGKIDYLQQLSRLLRMTHVIPTLADLTLCLHDKLVTDANVAACQK